MRCRVKQGEKHGSLASFPPVVKDFTNERFEVTRGGIGWRGFQGRKKSSQTRRGHDRREQWKHLVDVLPDKGPEREPWGLDDIEASRKARKYVAREIRDRERPVSGCLRQGHNTLKLSIPRRKPREHVPHPGFSGVTTLDHLYPRRERPWHADMMAPERNGVGIITECLNRGKETFSIHPVKAQ
jgi:hypothetical protein